MEWFKKKWKDIKDFFNVLKELRALALLVKRNDSDMVDIILKLQNRLVEFADALNKLETDFKILIDNDRTNLICRIDKVKEELKESDESDKKELRDFDDQDKQELSKRIDDLNEYIRKLKVANQLKDR